MNLRLIRSTTTSEGHTVQKLLISVLSLLALAFAYVVAAFCIVVADEERHHYNQRVNTRRS